MTINTSFIKELQGITGQSQNIDLMAVTKNRSVEEINSLIKFNIQLFGENKVQEAEKKFLDIKKQNKNIKLHLIGPLQSNKTINALKIFDCIQTIDRKKIIDLIAKYLNESWCCTKSFYIQINIGKEEQKSGIMPEDIKDLYLYAKSKNLNVIGLMCIPPNTNNVKKYFDQMNDIKKYLNKDLKLSMGMSNDYKEAILMNSNMIRIGSKLFYS